MKLQNFFQLAFTFLFAALVLVSCKDDEDDTTKAPVAAFTFSPSSPRVGETVTFSNTSTDAETFVWSATDAAFSSTEANPTFAFTTEGDVQVTLTASGDGGSNAVTQTITVLGEDAPIPPVVTYPSNYTEGTDAATSRASVIVASDANGVGENDITWTNDKVWVLDGFVFVNDGQTLTIEAGTVIKGKSGQGENASALVVARGGKVIAEGTATEGIVFTAEADDLNGNLGADENGLWGGLIILGKSGLNSTPGESAIEGIPTTESRGLYGGSDDSDNSGVYRYISVRHGGTLIGAGNEINGVTFGGVGSGTIVEHIEVYANQDDGFEWFGGTVNSKYLIATACGDDAFDYDEGYRGNVQFGLIYQREDAGDRGGEHDGGTDPEDGTPYALPQFYNITSIGNPSSRTITFRDNAGGEYHNSVFANYSKGVDIEFLASGESSYKRFQAGDLKLMNNTFVEVAGNDAAVMFTVATVEGKEPTDAELAEAEAEVLASFEANGNAVGSLGITRSNVVPTEAGGETSTPSNSFFTTTDYRGAFAVGSTPWYTGWTATEAFVQ
ncbi:PDK repeat-containing protein [Bernardetia litoralis DSM 6794]|uniref:PDK repeat-containing protein n=1 Tax=Bernardetia litoralis (strain ATCC 23117 / DSM 6794 / NBRC 15988 / NCIMB 1366 / Fx l1 / Sio-4) TaxID=880071 RepID=I4AL48_BERLS|nr:PKD domain-containing protein [Bernardetia litoralis]AFM04683.1 PDK repeat-containing protein [Bernardetia litoralis DSM 6794]